MHEVVWCVLHHFDLFQNDTPLLFHVLRVKFRIDQQIRQNIEGDRQVLVQYFRTVTNCFLRRESIQMSADGVNLTSDFLGRPMSGSFEKQMLDKMGDSIQLLGLTTRADLEPSTQRNGPHLWH